MGQCDVVGPAFPRVYLVIDEIATLSVPLFRLQFITFGRGEIRKGRGVSGLPQPPKICPFFPLPTKQYDIQHLNRLLLFCILIVKIYLCLHFVEGSQRYGHIAPALQEDAGGSFVL
jgi:hypothetical protein